jgi:hypothetical protein
MTDARWMPRWLFPTVAAAVVAPIVVAVLAQRNAHWHPVYDLAMTELRVRDVGSRHTPLIGLQGRIGPTGSHPGPLSFYLLAPVYRLLGSSAFALQAASATFHAGAAITALLIARRRGDGRIVIGVGIVLLLLIQGYGLGPLTEPWNPHLPVLWFVAFLVAVWSVLEGDPVMLLPAVFAGSVCAQTHVPYLAVALGLGGVVALVAVGYAWRVRGERAAPGWRWLAGALALGVLLWVPPLIDQAVHHPGNLTQLVDHLGTPTEAPIGIRQGAKLIVERLDAWQLVVGETQHPGTYIRVLSGPGPTRDRGLITLGIWVVCAGATVLLRSRRLLALHAMVAAAALIGVVAVSRIYGVPWYYLTLWGFGIGAMMALSIIATVAALVLRGRPTLSSPSATARLGLAGVVVVVALSVRLLVIAPDATTDTPDQTAQLARLVPATVAALEHRAGAATGHAGRYYLYWDDATNGGSEGIGLVNELVRRGYDIGVDARDGVKIAPYRVRRPSDATARIVVASGGWIDRWAAEPGATRVALDDPRSPAERREFEQVRSAAIARLHALGRDDLASQVDTDLFNVALNGGVAGDVSRLLGRLIAIGVPAAVFILPPEVGA